eukprot:s396_g30.t1
MPVRGDPDSLLVGRHVNFVDDVRSTLRQAAADRFDFVSIPLAAPQGQGIGCDFQPSVESCFSLEGEQWRTVVVGRVSDSLDPDTAATFAEAEVLRSQLETELRWAAHLGLQYVILPPPHAALGTGTSRGSCGYARAVGDLLAGGLFSLAAMEEAAPVALRVPATSDGWRAWNCFRTLCDHHAQSCPWLVSQR